jgi:hypothetical protein
MLNPSVDQLMSGMADALATLVLPELAPGPARDELQAAIALTRRLARAVPQLGPYLHTDIADLAATLTSLWSMLGINQPDQDPAAEAVNRALALPATPPPTTTELTALNLTLRQAVADLVGQPRSMVGNRHRADTDVALRALLQRLAEREADQLRLSPWAPLRTPTH